ncbi:MAG: MoxR family ATPase [Waddliaceae bacterium]|nr:MoxR family ATPase [Waddliaceae bacterium]MBT3579377.1 MoxR family ATPase [Waddliaceae bacterium]MBT4444867.1 MoxR family ATPase [Waddliaceae bacterium]MBT6928812.1 MoxR family ATPase [Waddliaceae bacterium]MBT7265140.1 MoxR family ATPase [Waddliaceae bacterium]
MTTEVEERNVAVQEHCGIITAIREEMGKAIIGQSALIDRLLIALLADGHILLEGLPGLAKTLAVNTLARTISCDFKRIQFTPDLLPADLIGTSIYNPKEGTFSVKKGPVFTNIVLADEVNRAPPKVQSALLEVMQEKQVTIGGEAFATGNPFLVLATQNPIEQEGTYPLPEAQTDRFMMKVTIGYPTRDEEKAIVAKYVGNNNNAPNVEAVIGSEDIIKLRGVVDDIYVDDKITEYILDIVFATRTPKAFGVDIEGLLDFGASPRATLTMTQAAKAHAFLNGRGYVTPHDVKSVGRDVLRHRLRLSYEAEAEEITSDDIIDRIFATILVP